MDTSFRLKGVDSERVSRRQFVGMCSAIGLSSVAPAVFGQDPLQHEVVLRTGLAYHPNFGKFSNNFYETEERVQWIHQRLTDSGAMDDLVPITPWPDPMSAIRTLHTQPHIDLINSFPHPEPYTKSAGEMASEAVAYVLGAVKAVCEGSVKNAFCPVRPPGHHVQNDGVLGYCFYANVVLAARFARQEFNIKRILIIDWDFHQGNGTHGFICGDKDILFFETFNPQMYTTHCDDFHPIQPFYPYYGAVPEAFDRINVRMPCGSTNYDFIKVFEDKLVPAAERFKPQLILISCGLDLKRYDTHGCFEVTSAGVSRLTEIVCRIAETYAEGRIISMLEGGYADNFHDPAIPGGKRTFSGLAQCAENHVKTLMTGKRQPETSFYE